MEPWLCKWIAAALVQYTPKSLYSCLLIEVTALFLSTDTLSADRYITKRTAETKVVAAEQDWVVPTDLFGHCIARL